MFQIVDSVVSTLTKFIDSYGQQVVIGVLVIVGAAILFKIFIYVLSGRGPDKS
jgi:hypothetical protein